ncbi:Protein of unknown function [Gryllus bimaculatus]|nr:Protein of unknown function [Gryllus bimaculatus]
MIYIHVSKLLFSSASQFHRVRFINIVPCIHFPKETQRWWPFYSDNRSKTGFVEVARVQEHSVYSEGRIHVEMDFETNMNKEDRAEGEVRAPPGDGAVHAAGPRGGVGQPAAVAVVRVGLVHGPAEAEAPRRLQQHQHLDAEKGGQSKVETRRRRSPRCGQRQAAARSAPASAGSASASSGRKARRGASGGVARNSGPAPSASSASASPSSLANAGHAPSPAPPASMSGPEGEGKGSFARSARNERTFQHFCVFFLRISKQLDVVTTTCDKKESNKKRINNRLTKSRIHLYRRFLSNVPGRVGALGDHQHAVAPREGALRELTAHVVSAPSGRDQKHASAGRRRRRRARVARQHKRDGAGRRQRQDASGGGARHAHAAEGGERAAEGGGRDGGRRSTRGQQRRHRCFAPYCSGDPN